MNADEKLKLARELSQQLHELANACLLAAIGDEQAKRTLRNFTDSYWFGLVVGSRVIEHLIENEETDA